MERKLRQDNYPVRRRHVGLAGFIIVLSQVITQFFSSSHSNKNISEELHQIRMDQEKYFVRKDEMDRVSVKLDRMGEDISEMNIKIKAIKTSVYNREKESKKKYPELSNFDFKDVRVGFRWHL